MCVCARVGFLERDIVEAYGRIIWHFGTRPFSGTPKSIGSPHPFAPPKARHPRGRLRGLRDAGDAGEPLGHRGPGGPSAAPRLRRLHLRPGAQSEEELGDGWGPGSKGKSRR